jgi:hypothetical protein
LRGATFSGSSTARLAGITLLGMNITPDLNDGINVFVFGSNLAGRHGKGAALEAKENWGAIYGQGQGFQGQSYAIPTKDKKLKTLPLGQIRNYVDDFLAFARKRPELRFLLTKIGCGLAGYQERQIFPMFESAPKNVIMPEGWEAF